MVDLTPPAASRLPKSSIRASRSLRRLAVTLAVAMLPSTGWAQKVRVTNLTDVSFGMVNDLQAESRRSQSICVYANGRMSSYSISASGSGAGSRFELSNGSYALPYRVEWSDSSGQSTGAALTAGSALTGQLSSATNQFCSTGPSASASLTIVLQASELSKARAGLYTGTLNLLIAAE